MARIAGIELKDKDRIIYALTNIKGIGWSLSKKLLEELGIEDTKRVGDLDTSDITKITKLLEKYPTEGELLRRVRQSISRLRNTSSYKGMRHARGLPVRGQRTKTNARTKRGKRKTVGAFKKEALTKMQQKPE